MQIEVGIITDNRILCPYIEAKICNEAALEIVLFSPSIFLARNGRIISNHNSFEQLRR